MPVKFLRRQENVPVVGFAEAPAWSSVSPGWRPLFGSYSDLGFSFEWHDFQLKQELDWARSFHPGSVELCLNLDGTGRLSSGDQNIELAAGNFAFYFQGEPALTASRRAGERHRFITVEFAPAFLEEHFRKQTAYLHPLVRTVVSGQERPSRVAEPGKLVLTLRQLMESLRHCPVFRPAQEMWFRSKALEIAAHLFFQPDTGEFLCTRTQRLARERVENAKRILKERMQDPPTLDELAHLVGSSPFYLSRQFAQEGGMTMQQYLRQVRMDRAAELLRTGKCNVTEAALEVGYNSLSHFSSAFHETFGCCPGLYPVRTAAQQAALPSEGDLNGVVQPTLKRGRS
jgi:AraC-like DNA-binding protein